MSGTDSNKHQEPIDGLINYTEIHDYKKFRETFTMTLSQLDHIYEVHWEIDPASASNMIEIIGDLMKAFADTYKRGIEEGWIPPNLQYQALNGAVKDIHDAQ